MKAKINVWCWVSVTLWFIAALTVKTGLNSVGTLDDNPIMKTTLSAMWPIVIPVTVVYVKLNGDPININE